MVQVVLPQDPAVLAPAFGDFNHLAPQLTVLPPAAFRDLAAQLAAGVFHQLNQLGGHHGVDLDQIAHRRQ